MGLDFDAVEYCKSVKLQQPPFACPVAKCDKSYKTIVGLQYHLLNYDHDNPQLVTPLVTPNRKKAGKRGANHSTPKTPKAGASGGVSGADDGQNGAGKQISNPESLVTFNDEEQTVQFNIDGKSVRLGVDDPLPFVDDVTYENLIARGRILNPNAPPLEENASWARVQVPEPRFREIEDYNVPDAPTRPLAYYRFIEKSAEELDGEIEYDVDEEDSAWLEWMNEHREKGGLNAVSIDTMELLMDRLEKESFFQAAANGTTTGVEVDDDAVCCICLDGECQNTNVILFCDMCNLAVHQDCYGVPYIPEGQWLCRRCLQSPSTPVNCVLCPNVGGAFKQTDRGQWAHVVCALWIPEVRFANTVFLEPIDSIENISVARWRLTCYVCKEKGLGACIQCQRNSCYAAFHVTCAQQAGLYMTMDTVKDGHNDSSVQVQKYAYCHSHTPADAKLKTNQKEVEDTRHKMKEARKALAKKRSTAPVVLIPTIPADRVQEIAGMVHMKKKQQFLDRLIAYWTLKRQYRNGVPLLRRLQSQGNHHGVIHRNGIEGSPDTTELYKQLKYWQCLRQDLERARLLCELVRKREKLKATYVKICEQVVMLQLNPLESMLSGLLDTLEAKDTSEIFHEPVDIEEVPDYLDIVKHPMDLGTMRRKLREGQYTTLELMEADFDLMIQNCLAYNNKDTVFYRAGIRMRDQAAPLFQKARKDMERAGLADHRPSEHADHVEMEIDEELKELLASPACEETVQKLLILADKSQVLKNPSYRTKKIKQIRLEITRMRKVIQKAKIAARNACLGVASQSDDEGDYYKRGLNKTASSDRSIAASKHKHQPKRQRKQAANSMMEDDDDDEDVEEEEEEDEEPDDDDEDHDDEEDEDDTMGEESKGTTTTTVQTPPCSPIKNVNNSASPVGVNRRTAVLFTRKAQAALKRPSETPTPVKEESMSQAGSTTTSTSLHAVLAASAAATAAPLMNSKSSLGQELSGVGGADLATPSSSLSLSLANHLSALGPGLGSLSANSLSSAVKSPKRNARHKRLSDVRNSSSMSPKKSPNLSLSSTIPQTSSDMSYDRIPDSFRVYRANNERDVSDSDDDDMSDGSGSPCSSCTGFSMTGSGSDYDSSDDDEDEDEDRDKQSEDEEEEEEEDEDDGEGDEDEDEVGKDGRKSGLGIGEDGGGGHAVGGNGEAMLSCGSGAEDDEMSRPSTSSKRTPTPSEKRSRPRSVARGKQKKRNRNPVSTPVTDAESTTMTSPGGAKSARGRSTTPTAVNNVKSKRSTVNSKKLNNSTHETTPLPASQTQANDSGDKDPSTSLIKPPLEPLQLVWAKCRGYPWYPALILDPKTPKGFVYNGVALPAPPSHVLALRKNYSEDEVFLVLFFDAKRTWQWLPANKLEILGIDKGLDQQKLVESRKPTDRKAVKKAYQDALHYQSQVSDLEGQGPDPIM